MCFPILAHSVVFLFVFCNVFCGFFPPKLTVGTDWVGGQVVEWTDWTGWVFGAVFTVDVVRTDPVDRVFNIDGVGTDWTGGVYIDEVWFKIGKATLTIFIFSLFASMVEIAY